MKIHIVQFLREWFTDKQATLFADKHANMRLLWDAASEGNVEEVRRLIPISYCANWNSQPLINAARNGHTECVRLLIPVSNPKDYNTALWFTSGTGNVECVKLLLTVADPKHDNSRALVAAVIRQRQDVIDLLYPVSDPDAALQQMRVRFKNLMAPYQDFIERVEEGRFKRQLTKIVGDTRDQTPLSAPKRKM